MAEGVISVLGGDNNRAGVEDIDLHELAEGVVDVVVLLAVAGEVAVVVVGERVGGAGGASRHSLPIVRVPR